MRLTKKLALKITLELWTWLAETGEWKWAWPGWKKYDPEMAFASNCPLCEYCYRHGTSFEWSQKSCGECPYKQATGVKCLRYFNSWIGAVSRFERKVAAQACVDQLRKML